MLANEERPLIVDVRSHSQPGRRVAFPARCGSTATPSTRACKASGLHERTAQEVIVYCACPNEASAALVAKKLMRAGFKRVRPLRGGIDAWIEKGYAVEVG